MASTLSFAVKDVTTISSSTVTSAVDESFQTTTQVVTSVNLAILMFGLGAAISPQAMLSYFKTPKQFLTGLFLQLFLMPFLGLGLTQMVRMPNLEALGVLIQASCPGGTYSNIMSYWLDGDMNLSVVMTTASTILAMGTMPLWLFVMPLILGAGDAIEIPYDQLGYALLGSVGPIFIGMFIKWKWPQYADKVTKFCTILASVSIIVTSIVIGATQQTTIILTWRQGLLAVLFPLFSLALGYGATRLPWLTFTVSGRRTVAIETAMQNSAIATTIVILSFDTTSDDFITVFIFPVLYGGVQLFGGAAAVATYIILKKKGRMCLVPPEVLDGTATSAIEGGPSTKVAPVINGDAEMGNGNLAKQLEDGIDNPSFNSDSTERAGSSSSSEERLQIANQPKTPAGKTNYNESET